MNDEKKQEIINALASRNATKGCSRCLNDEFVILDGYFHHKIRPRAREACVDGVQSTGYLPIAVIICKKCGYLSQHAVGILDITKDEE